MRLKLGLDKHIFQGQGQFCLICYFVCDLFP
jgi:hypothetical protein